MLPVDGHFTDTQLTVLAQFYTYILSDAFGPLDTQEDPDVECEEKTSEIPA